MSACGLSRKGMENMGVRALEHVTIRCGQLRRTRDFYVELMGLTEGERPAFPFRGYWLYLGGIIGVSWPRYTKRRSRKSIAA